MLMHIYEYVIERRLKAAYTISNWEILKENVVSDRVIVRIRFKFVLAMRRQYTK